MRMVRRMWAAAALAAAGCGPDYAAPPGGGKAASAAVETLASYPAGTFLENISIGPDGAAYFTNYTGRSIETWRAGAGASTFATLAVHPMSVLAEAGGFIVVAHRGSFIAGDDVTGQNVLLRLDAAGVVLGETPVPDAGFLNGVVRLNPEIVLVSDSAKAQILAYRPAADTVEVWLTDQPELVGVNGLEIGADGSLYFASHEKKGVYRVALAPDGAPGAITPLAEGLVNADDLVALPDGGFVVTTHDASVLRLDAIGAAATLVEAPVVLGNTAVEVVGEGDARRALVLGTGGVTSGGTGEAALVSVPLP